MGKSRVTINSLLQKIILIILVSLLLGPLPFLQ